jgi:hypothetical protein
LYPLNANIIKLSLLHILEQIVVVFLLYHPSPDIVGEARKIGPLLPHLSAPLMGRFHLKRLLSWHSGGGPPAALNFPACDGVAGLFELALVLFELQLLELQVVELVVVAAGEGLVQLGYLQEFIATAALLLRVLLLESLEEGTRCLGLASPLLNLIGHNCFIFIHLGSGLLLLSLRITHRPDVCRGTDLQLVAVVFDPYWFLIAQDLQVEAERCPAFGCNLQDVFGGFFVVFGVDVGLQGKGFIFLGVFCDNFQIILLFSWKIDCVFFKLLLLPDLPEEGRFIIVLVLGVDAVELFLDPLKLFRCEVGFDGLVHHFAVVVWFLDAVADGYVTQVILRLVAFI